jgi:hypothetical protein
MPQMTIKEKLAIVMQSIELEKQGKNSRAKTMAAVFQRGTSGRALGGDSREKGF